MADSLGYEYTLRTDLKVATSDGGAAAPAAVWLNEVKGWFNEVEKSWINEVKLYMTPAPMPTMPSATMPTMPTMPSAQRT